MGIVVYSIKIYLAIDFQLIFKYKMERYQSKQPIKT